MTAVAATAAGPTVDPASRLTGLRRWVYEAVMIALAVAVVALLWLEPAGWGHPANLAIWAAFVVDYAVRAALSDDRRRFVTTQWVDLIAILPLDFFRAARILRLARLLRLMRAGSIVWRVSANVRGVLRTNGLGAVLAVSATLIVAGGLAIWAVEPAMGDFGDAAWWAVVTTTTVGYGDISPTTGLGRIVAGVLMVVGIGTIGMITGSIATYFIGEHQHQQHPHVEFLRAELARWDAFTPAERHRLVTLLANLAQDTDPP